MIENKLKQILKQLKITQKDLSSKTGIDEPTLSSFGSPNKKYVYLNNLEIITSALGISIGDIFTTTSTGLWCLDVVNGSGAVISSFNNLNIRELKALIGLCVKCDKKTIVWNNKIKDRIDGSLFLKTLQDFN